MNKQPLHLGGPVGRCLGESTLLSGGHTPHNPAQVSCAMAGTEQASGTNFYQINHIKQTKIIILDILLDAIFGRKSLDYCLICAAQY